MTAVTLPATATTGGGPLAEPGPKAVQNCPPEGRSATADGTVPAPRVPAAGQPHQGGSGLVGDGGKSPAARVISGPPTTGFVTTSGHVSQQVAPAALPVGRDTSDGGEPASATAGAPGTELSAEAYVEALDGGERTLLLRTIATAWPEVVTAAAGLVAAWHAECAEERRKNARRREHERRRRRRAEADGGG